MKNNITTKGLDNIINHLQNRIKGYIFKEISINELGVKNNYSLFQIQTAAEIMMQHLFMTNYTPIIELIELPNGIAGRTNLNDDKLVYISLDRNHFNTKQYTKLQLLTIIAHELCHKFLWVHGFRETSHKIEFITDACAVYVGFGPILIEGVEVKNHSFDGYFHITRTMYIGYLEKWQIEYLRNVFHNIPIPSKWNFGIIGGIFILIGFILSMLILILNPSTH